MYICPKCGEKLNKTEGSMKCAFGHCYDISSKGYINFLSGGKGGGHGDSKEMLLARREFLEKGHYAPIITKLSDMLTAENKVEITVLDAGCGEGYYTSALKNELEARKISCNIYGIDVSKEAILLAAKKYKDIAFSVASVNAIPYENSSFDVVISLFAPLAESEFDRVLKNDGRLITVSPSENHLFGLKTAVYDAPLKNPPSTFVPKILKKDASFSSEWSCFLDNRTDIQNLFKMTPYYHKTSPGDIRKAMSLTELRTDIGFEFCVYSK